ncbi:MAG: adenosine deaminase [Gammaproteobacteria bacterium]
MKNITMAMIAATTIMMSGCATILNDDTQSVNLTTSNGKKTIVSVNGREYEAPGIARLVRSQDDAIITADTSTCKGKTVAPSSVDTVFFVNILSGGAFGSTTDYASEEMWKYDNTIQINCL